MSVTELQNPNLLVWLAWTHTLFLLVPGAAVWAWEIFQHRGHSTVKSDKRLYESHEDYRHAA